MSEKIYDPFLNDVGSKLNEVIPDEWEKIFLYAEILDGGIELYFWFVDSKKKQIVECMHIPQVYNIERNKIQYSMVELSRIISDMSEFGKRELSQNWTTMALIIENTGNFHMDLTYDDLDESDGQQRRIEWEKKYLGR